MRYSCLQLVSEPCVVAIWAMKCGEKAQYPLPVTAFLESVGAEWNEDEHEWQLYVAGSVEGVRRREDELETQLNELFG